ncbi:MAG: galactose/methyl galactoside ABC transporter permease MglC [Butyricicoccus pullicaecorum]|nr:galactose/methyl galactoside ABC transporter permease MglC [Butyricicoccus pullicaecorum]
MNSGKQVTYTTYYGAMAIIGAVLLAFGIGLNVFEASAGLGKTLYDLPWFIGIIGVALLGSGLSKALKGRRSPGLTVPVGAEHTKKFLLNNAILLALAVLVVIICIQEHSFMQIRVMKDILAQASPRVIIALGICFTLLIAGTDLSACRMVGLAAVISASMMQTADYANRFYPDLPQIPVIFAIAAAILACMVFGALNGFLVARFDMHPFIATLAVQVMIYGACSLYFDMEPNKSQPIGGIRDDFSAIGKLKILTSDFVERIPIIGKLFGGISILILIAIVFIVAIWFVLNYTVFGKNVYAIGGNREAAVVSGINVPLTIMGIFILASAMYGVGGVLEAARTAGATNNYGVGYELDAIAACVVGGVSLNGGVGKVSGILSGVLIFQVIQYGLQFIGISPMWQQIIKGIIIAAAVAIDMSKYNKK